MGGFITSNQTDAIAASWDRCARRYNLRHDTGRPIMRLQSSEVAPRLEKIVESTGGRQGFFQHLASVAGEIGHCLVVTDADGVSVRIEHSGATSGSDGWNGIALGSCWDERLAGTNGVSMALRTGHAVTVRGADHYFSMLRQFACTGIPVLDAHGEMIGAINLVSVDRGNRADYLFSQQLLARTAHRIQRNLFETEFRDAMLVTVSRGGRDHVLSDDALVAVNEAGMIIGATSTVSACLDGANAASLTGQAFEAVFNLDSNQLVNVPERVLSMPGNPGAAVNLTAALPKAATPRQVAEPLPSSPVRKHRLPPSLQQLATGSHSMAAACRRAREVLKNTAMLHLEGETGTGKSALVAALLQTDTPDAQIIDLDCATLGDRDADKDHLRMVIEQARVHSVLPNVERFGAALIFDNVDELPKSSQAELRRFLKELEKNSHNQGGYGRDGNLIIVSTSRKPLIDAVNAGHFRDDLFYLLTGGKVVLPPLRAREHPEVLAQALCAQLTGRTVTFSAEAKDALRRLAFYGNVREMRAVLQNALAAAQGNQINLFDLQQTAVAAPPSSAMIAPSCVTGPGNLMPVYDERSMILEALSSSRWNVSEAARVLGMGRATINRKLKLYEIKRPI
ncbi:sigma-54-dependent Fis family transcriptional regulator [Gymnodinialimonas ceratoperidinii]|uniref:Sigma 54-interacting transcriptional regulator n=1 Tax=Gymnodinialimonas ceratoperidinii TaxID=2856823 RepID=A0A8F6Y9L3_9RHOB|nr:helix-turn-helix domain-containing protein [Gymnodinialimonas ceratoperidinii]QXT39069.1 sigma 54-interacting transcriptional regulator [Gymnodinialimonas ceratoperidinii]